MKSPESTLSFCQLLSPPGWTSITFNHYEHIQTLSNSFFPYPSLSFYSCWLLILCQWIQMTLPEKPEIKGTVISISCILLQNSSIELQTNSFLSLHSPAQALSKTSFIEHRHYFWVKIENNIFFQWN